jgi:hypothetical protein
MMIKKAVAGLGFVAMMTAGAGVAMANECGLNDKQLAAGWQCLEEIDTTTSYAYEQAGKSHMCQVMESTVTVVYFTAYNPAGNQVDEKSGEVVISAGDWTKAEGGNVTCP